MCVSLRADPPVARSLTRKGGWIPAGVPLSCIRSAPRRRCFSASPPSKASRESLACSLRPMAPSRQERRKAERDAAKRAPARAGAAGAREAAAALANLNVNPLGDWNTQAEDPTVGPCGYCLLATQDDVVQPKRRDVKVWILTWRATSARPDPWVLLDALGTETVRRRASEGDGEAEWSFGYLLMSRACVVSGEPLGAAGRSPQADVGFELCTA